jgi:hypothetical protein
MQIGGVVFDVATVLTQVALFLAHFGFVPVAARIANLALVLRHVARVVPDALLVVSDIPMVLGNVATITSAIASILAQIALLLGARLRCRRALLCRRLRGRARTGKHNEGNGHNR